MQTPRRPLVVSMRKPGPSGACGPEQVLQKKPSKAYNCEDPFDPPQPVVELLPTDLDRKAKVIFYFASPVT